LRSRRPRARRDEGNEVEFLALLAYILVLTGLQRAVGSRAVRGNPSGLCFGWDMDTTVYIDGFNLYYRLLKTRPASKWLNPVALVRRILPHNNITKVRYFTARVSGRVDADAPRRQQLYLDALGTLPELEIHYGTFLEVRKYAGLVTPVLDRHVAENKMPFLKWPDVAYVWKTEEKGSDVNIATYLLLDGFQRKPH